MLDVSLHRLRVFKAVVDQEGFNRAARRLGISEPSVSEHIRALEDQTGPLFVRRPGRGIELTRAGELIYRFCDEVFQSEKRLEEGLAAIQGKVGGVVLVAQRTIASHLLTPQIARYLRLHPEVKVAVHTETQHGVFQHLQQGSADLGIAWSLDGDAPFPSTLLCREDMLFVCSPAHDLALRAVISPKELAAQPFVGPLTGSEYAKLMLTSTRAIGMPGLNYVVQLEDSDTLKTALLEGLGYGLMPRFVVAPDLAQGRLVQIAVAAPSIRWQVRLYLTAHHPLSPEAEAVRRYLTKSAPWTKLPEGAVRV